MPQVHFIGELEGGTDFEFPNLYCKWSITPTEMEGDTWDEIGGEEHGQTQVDMCKPLQDGVWAHPFDVHYACSTYVSFVSSSHGMLVCLYFRSDQPCFRRWQYHKGESLFLSLSLFLFLFLFLFLSLFSLVVCSLVPLFCLFDVTYTRSV